MGFYGFARITQGSDKGAYYHKKFQRGQLDLLQEMVVVGHRRRSVSDDDVSTTTRYSRSGIQLIPDTITASTASQVSDIEEMEAEESGGEDSPTIYENKQVDVTTTAPDKQCEPETCISKETSTSTTSRCVSISSSFTEEVAEQLTVAGAGTQGAMSARATSEEAKRIKRDDFAKAPLDVVAETCAVMGKKTVETL